MQAFTYTASVKFPLGTDSAPIFKDEYPGVTDLNVSSREFVDYNDCIMSCRAFMDDVKSRINLGIDNIIFKVNSEINPVFSGQPTLSKDWDTGEVARIWIFDETMEKSGQIHAIGQARIFSTNRPRSVTLSS